MRSHVPVFVVADSYIELDAASLSPGEAERTLLELLNAYDTKMTPEFRSGAHRIELTLAHGEPLRLAVPDLLTELHLTGACELDRARWIDTDPYGSVAIEVPEGVPIVIATGSRNSPPLHGPGYATNDVVTELLDDVLLYRKAVVQSSHPGQMYQPAFRAYRAYLIAGISAIDACLNRLSWLARNDSSSQLTSADANLLSKNSVPLDQKLRRWPLTDYRLPITGYRNRIPRDENLPRRPLTHHDRDHGARTEHSRR